MIEIKIKKLFDLKKLQYNINQLLTLNSDINFDISYN